MNDEASYRLGMIIEQSLGHITHGLNLKERLAQDASITAHWVLPPYAVSGLAARLPLYGSNWTVRAGLRTRRQLSAMERHMQLDALFFHTQVTATLAGDWLKRVPSVISLDATPRQMDRLGQFYTHPTGPNWLENVKWRASRASFRLARRLVTWSEWARDGLVDEYEVPCEKITVIPPGVDTQAWQPPDSQRKPGDPVRILFVGGDFVRKGGPKLLEAFRALHTSWQPEAELHVVTQTPLSAGPGVFVYNDLTPNSEKLRQLYYTSDIFCLPTQGDCLPLALAEAGAAGLPVISTRVAAIPEVVLHGETGFLVDPGDVGDLCGRLAQLSANAELRRAQSQAGQRLIRERFDAKKNAARLVALLKSIVDEERATMSKEFGLQEKGLK
jgi:glycosyltransferase involved in cell wall biosynthesis